MTPEELAAIRERDRQDLDAEKTFANRTWGFFHAANDRGRLLAEVDRLTAQSAEQAKIIEHLERVLAGLRG